MEKNYKSGEVIFKEQDPGGSMFKILTGEIDVFGGYGTDNETKFATLKAGDSLGEMSLFENAPRNATAIAATDCTIDELASKDNVLEKLKENKGWAHEIISSLCLRIREQNKLFSDAIDTMGEMSPEKKSLSGGILNKILTFLRIAENSPDDEEEITEDTGTVEAFIDEKFYTDRKEAYPKGGIVFKEGSFGENMYLIITGSVGVYKNYGEENEKQLAVLKEGQLFGEMGILDLNKRSATVVTLESTVTAVITKYDIDDIFDISPEQVYMIIRQLSNKLRNMDIRILGVSKDIKKLKDKRDKGLLDIDEYDRTNHLYDMYRGGF